MLPEKTQPNERGDEMSEDDIDPITDGIAENIAASLKKLKKKGDKTTMADLVDEVREAPDRKDT